MLRGSENTPIESLSLAATLLRVTSPMVVILVFKIVIIAIMIRVVP